MFLASEFPANCFVNPRRQASFEQCNHKVAQIMQIETMDCFDDVRFCLITCSFPSRMFVSSITWYQISQRKLLAANEKKRFKCKVIRAHLRDLKMEQKSFREKMLESCSQGNGCQVLHYRALGVIMSIEKCVDLKKVESENIRLFVIPEFW